jgi:hypothetical protein
MLHLLAEGLVEGVRRRRRRQGPAHLLAEGLMEVVGVRWRRTPVRRGLEVAPSRRAALEAARHEKLLQYVVAPPELRSEINSYFGGSFSFCLAEKKK